MKQIFPNEQLERLLKMYYRGETVGRVFDQAIKFAREKVNDKGSSIPGYFAYMVGGYMAALREISRGDYQGLNSLKSGAAQTQQEMGLLDHQKE